MTNQDCIGCYADSCCNQEADPGWMTFRADKSLSCYSGSTDTHINHYPLTLDQDRTVTDHNFSTTPWSTAPVATVMNHYLAMLEQHCLHVKATHCCSYLIDHTVHTAIRLYWFGDKN